MESRWDLGSRRRRVGGDVMGVGVRMVKGHQAVIGNDIPTKDSVIEFRFRLGGAQSVTAEFDDRAFTGSHYGHICMARISAKGM